MGLAGGGDEMSECARQHWEVQRKLFTRAIGKHKELIEKQRAVYQGWQQWKQATGGWQPLPPAQEAQYRTGPEVPWPNFAPPMLGQCQIQNWRPPTGHEGECTLYSRAPKAGRVALMHIANLRWSLLPQCQAAASQTALDKAIDDGALSSRRAMEVALCHAQQAAQAAWNYHHGYALYNPDLLSHHKLQRMHVELTCPLCSQLLVEPLTINVAHHLLPIGCDHSFCHR